MAKLEEIFDNSSPGKKIALLGNEAIARAIVEAGVSALFTYPGTPSSEIPNTLYAAIKSGIFERLNYDFYLEWSANEKVALESAYGYSFSGKRTVFVCKHVGLNVAADALMTLINAGVKGGLVILEAEDPNMYSSQNEQDNRWYSKLANIPVFEPSDANEAMSMLKAAFDLSEKFETPVMIRSVTRISHSKLDVTLSEIKPPQKTGEVAVQIDPGRFVCVPANARKNKIRILRIIKEIEEYLESSSWNSFEEGTNREIGFIVAGSAYVYLKDVCEIFREKCGTFSIAKIGVSHPFPRKFIVNLLKRYPDTKWVVVEEGDPVIETFVKKTAQEIGHVNKIFGREDNVTPSRGEMTIRVLAEGIQNIFDFGVDLEKIPEDRSDLLIARPPVLCPGCPHRGTFYQLNRVVKKRNRLVSTDIGCYTLGAAPPLFAGHVVIDMGSSFGIGHGLSAIPGLNQTVVSIIGDSTFWASGLAGLANAVYNKSKLLAIIVDNSCTAMTGFQPHPSSEPNPYPESQLSIEKVVRAMGVPVYIIDPYHPKENIEKFKEAASHDGVSVVISKGECRIQYQHREGLPSSTYYIDSEECVACHNCVNLLACPAILWSDKKKIKGSSEKMIPYIDQDICTRCELCVEVCPYGAIKKSEGDH
ncbi:MAG: thiamine pyrophosphate-dependent enzyme [Candidatus Hodarchaeales archaeon]